MILQAEIFSQGHELIIGQIVDSNAAWLAEQLTELGFSITRHTTAGDNLTELIAVMQEIANRADLCICTGGLGPTCDDLTTEAVSSATELPLVFDEDALSEIQAFFQRRDRSMPEANRKQAYLPAESQRIVNPVGTAPGFALHYQNCWFVFLPGVPLEMKTMFEQTVKAQLKSRFNLRPGSLVTLRTVGIGESLIQQTLKDLVIPNSVQLGFRASLGEVSVKLSFPFAYPDVDKRELVTQVAELIGEAVYGIDGLTRRSGDLATVIADLLKTKHNTLATLETISLGCLAAKSSLWPSLTSAQIALNDQQLATISGLTFSQALTATDLERVALAIKTQAGTDIALIQYAIDNTATSAQSRQIALFNVLSYGNQQFKHSQHKLTGNSNQIQQQAALLSLDLLRRYLQQAVIHE